MLHIIKIPIKMDLNNKEIHLVHVTEIVEVGINLPNHAAVD